MLDFEIQSWRDSVTLRAYSQDRGHWEGCMLLPDSVSVF